MFIIVVEVNHFPNHFSIPRTLLFKNNTCSYHITALTILKHLSFSNYTVGILQQCGITYEKKLEKPSKNHHPRHHPPTTHVGITPWMIPCPTNSNAKCWWWQRLGTMKLGCVNGDFRGFPLDLKSALKNRGEENVEKPTGLHKSILETGSKWPTHISLKAFSEDVWGNKHRSSAGGNVDV